MGRSSGCHYIDGAFVASESAEQVDVLEKATGAVMGTAAVGGAHEVDRAVAAAERSRHEWAAAPYTARAAVLRAAAAGIEGRSAELIDVIVRETGAIAAKAEYEVWAGASYLYQAAELAARTGGEILPSAMPGKMNLVRRMPLGTVGIITPWNFPVVLGVYTLAPALAVGNAVVLKPAPDTPISGGQLLAEILDDAGVPAGVFNVVTGEGDAVGEPLVTHADVAMIHFTGSTAVGRRINMLAAEQLKRVSLEMGGNNALLVLDDADPEHAAMIGAFAAFNYQGQTCITAGRHIVMSSVADAYTESLVRRAAGIPVGDPTDPNVGMGPIINQRQLERAVSLLGSATTEGASVLQGGTHEGLFMAPTVLGGVSADNTAFREELFAPIAPITVVDTEEEALELVNRTDYGLVNSIVTGDPMRGLALAERVHSGMVHVNDVTTLVEPNVPFGGIGLSGLGRPTGGSANLEHFTERQWISVARQPVEYPW
ncbi:MAG: aldehyde dehydrogenase family protein [Acidimicrobiales bacterium]